MRIVQLLPDINLGGVERGVVELSAALVANGQDSVVVSRAGLLSDTITKDGGLHVDFDCGGKNPLTVPRRARRLRALLDEISPDIVHIRSRVPAWLLRFGGKNSLKNKFAVVSTFHGIYRVNRYSARMADAMRIICPSRAVMNYVAENYDAPAEKLRLIHRGVDLDYFSPAQVDADFCAEFRRQHGLPEGKIIAIAGRLSSLKGHDVFLRAIAEVRQQNAVNAMIVGGGNERRLLSLQQMAAELGIADNVYFVGGQQQMREIYHLTDVVVSASRRPEAFGRTMAEALAMERPVVAPAHGGALDIITEGENGCLFAPADATALAEAMSRALQTDWHGLRDSVQKFSLTQMVEKTLAVYEEVMQNRQTDCL